MPFCTSSLELMHDVDIVTLISLHGFHGSYYMPNGEAFEGACQTFVIHLVHR